MSDDVLQSPFIIVRSATDRNRVDEFLQTLDPGESEALALALEVRASAILIDESEGRAAAKRLGLVTVGVLGILSAGKHQGIIPAIGPVIERLREELGFFVAPSLLSKVLREAGE